MNKIAILGTAANPIHYGHIQTAKYILDKNICDEVWITPTYKHRYNKELLDAEHRLNMCDLLIDDNRIKVCDFEIKNKLSGETYNFIKLLKEEYDNKFYYIIGQDNANSFDKWFNYNELLKIISFIIVPRKGIQKIDNNIFDNSHIYLDGETNIIECSSTKIRNLIKEKEYKLLEEYLNVDVIDYIIKNNLYM